jgi:Rps23 Pro-64 3,4-dihydroxylase Tpa1-like proline 4-hydroxylase
MNYNELIKIKPDDLESINKLGKNILSKFGNWVNNIDILKSTFINALPFEHIVIDDFLNETYADELYNLFPEKFDNWHVYDNPIEVKYTYDNVNDFNDVNNEMKNYFYYLASDEMIGIFRKLTGMHDLTYDEYLHGAGLHCHPRYGRLNIHLDYEKHPISGKERRLNIILFLTKNWREEWGGQNELWNKDASKCVTKTDIKFNRAIIFKTNDISWHGLPRPIMCPEGHFRKSLAFYYVSPLTCFKTEYRNKAKYILTDDSIKNDLNLQNLCKIRSNRRLTIDDIKLYCPDWKKEDM